MKITRLKTLAGPNIWSVGHNHLIVATIDTENAEQQQQQEDIHSLKQKFCKEFSLLDVLHRSQTDGFKDVQNDNSLTLVKYVEVLASGMLALAAMPCDYSMCWPDKQTGLIELVIGYEIEKAGRYAVKAAVDIVVQLLNGEACDIAPHINALRKIRTAEMPGPSTLSIIDEAKRRDIPVLYSDDAYVQLGYGAHQKRIQATIASTTSGIAIELAGDKQETKQLLRAAKIPVPEGGVATTENELNVLMDKIGFPLVIKPVDGNQGKLVATNIQSAEDGIIAFHAAQTKSEQVICEQFIPGSDFRALVINYQFVAAALRVPACVKGTGLHTIQQLIDRVNSDVKRGEGHENIMTKIEVDEHTLHLLAAKGYNTSTVLPLGEICYLKSAANLSAGGTASNVTNNVHPKNIAMFNRIARTIGLDICGIDIVANNLSTPIAENGGAIIEVNAAPGFRMHLYPSKGSGINVAAPVVDMLFPGNNKGRIPIIAVTGTNGKTTTTCLAAHICRQQGLVTGLTNTNGIYIQQEQVMSGDCSGPSSAQIVLKDASVEVAVLECARGGILRRGLGFDACDVAIITNIAEDHLGLNGIHTLQELAQVKSVVAKSVKQNGYAVLNADDDLVYKMHRQLSCNIALFSMEANNYRVKKHVSENGIAAVYEEGLLVLYKNGRRQVVCSVNDVPITFNGMAEFNVANTLGALLAGVVQGYSIESIREALRTFMPSPEHNPGRLNIFEFNDFTLMIDYAHNSHGVKALGKFINGFTTARKTGIIAGVGDRRDEDLVALGKEAAIAFDDIIVRTDDDKRGRTVEQIFYHVKLGINYVKPEMAVQLVADETEAIKMALNNSKPGSFVVVLVDKVERALAFASDVAQRQQTKETIPFKLLAYDEQRFKKVAG